MAKLKAPLLSLGASQKLGGVLVFFNWKGLDVAREYVIPANPRTTGQVTQRGYMSTAVQQIHNEQARSPNGLDADDVVAYQALANLEATPRTWFNQLAKLIIDRLVAGLGWMIFRNGSAVAGAGQATITIFSTYSGVAPTNCNINYGTSPTAMFNTQATTKLLLEAGVVVAGLVAGVKYYFQIRQTAPATHVTNISGIYHCTPT